MLQRVTLTPFLLDNLRRAIPIRYRKLIPKAARRWVSFLFLVEAWTLISIAQFTMWLMPQRYRSAVPQDNPSPAKWLRAMADYACAKECLVNNDFAKARECMNRSIGEVPGIGDLHYLRGHIAVALNDPEAAVQDLTKSIECGYDSADVHFYLAIALSTLARHNEAIHHYEVALEKCPDWAQAMVNLAHLRLWNGEEEAAAKLLQRAIQIEPEFSMAHQNLAALYDRWRYKPSSLDLEGRRELLLYDAYNYLGERAFHVGLGNRDGIRLWTRALRLQREIAKDFSLPKTIIKKLGQIPGIDWSLPFRVLPYEWVTQIGHLAMLDTYYKIQSLGWRPPANLLLLAPLKKVANLPYLKEWRNYFHVISNKELVDALFPYQRYIGDCFNAYLQEDGRGVSWTDTGARAHIAWDEQKRNPLLKLTENQLERGAATLRALGMPHDVWFACLHVREGGFHREGAASIQGHRNSTIADYLPAIRSITDRGGWVVRMGDSSMSPMPSMRGVIDYAHSPVKSDWMDVYLCGAARFFIGTTSGLTNAVISYGTPCVLVNCLSNFSQLWNNRVIFTLKMFWSERERRYLKLAEMINDPVRSSVFNIRVMNELGLVPYNNSSKEILEAVEEMSESLGASNNENWPNDHRLPDAWKKAVSDNPFFGNARPGKKFLEEHYDTLL